MGSYRYIMKEENDQKMNASLLYISTSKYEGDWQSIPHIHHFSELIYITGGRGSFLLEGVEYEAKEGDMVIISPDLEHTELSSDSSPLEYIAAGISGVSFRNTNGIEGHFIFHCSGQTILLTILNLLLEEVKEEKLGYDTACRSLLKMLLIYLVREQPLIPSPFTAAKMTRECSLVKRYLDTNYSESITLEQLSALAHMSKYYLVHAFTRYAGLSPISYLNTRRIDISRELLTSTDHSIAQIASLVGFSSQSYFAQVFKREAGKSPAQYRREYNEKTELET